MIIALIGADGQLGSDLAAVIPKASLQPLIFPEFDVTRPRRTADILRELRPDVVINTAAFHRVDECEDRIEDAYRVNAFAVRNLAGICRDLGAVLVHFSTDYVFDGGRGTPYGEDDPPGPLSAYAASKLAGENFIRSAWDRHIIIRTCGLFGRAGCLGKGRNFVETMLWMAERGGPIRVVSDQCITPTSTAELTANVLALLDGGAFGLYHLTNEGECTWYEFAREIFSLAGVDADVHPIDTATLGAKARRPAYSVLAKTKARAAGLPGFSDWRTALADYLHERRIVAVG
jgi:dTDP-4-dehydrorhamnose reductase